MNKYNFKIGDICIGRHVFWNGKSYEVATCRIQIGSIQRSSVHGKVLTSTHPSKVCIGTVVPCAIGTVCPATITLR